MAIPRPPFVRLHADPPATETRSHPAARVVAESPHETALDPRSSTPSAPLSTSPGAAPGRVSKGVPTGGQFAATPRGEADVSLGAQPEGHLDAQADAQADEPGEKPSGRDALTPALSMNRVEAERHVRSLIDEAADAGDPERLDEIASLAATPGWKGVAALRRYPHTTSPECGPSEFLPTKAAATRTAEYASDRMSEAERNAQNRTGR